MSARRQVPTPLMLTVENTRIWAFPIVCGTCSIRDGMAAKKFSGGIPFEIYRKYFFHKFWDVHHIDPRRDKCPSCVKLDEAARRQRYKEPPPRPVPDVSRVGAPQPFIQFGPTYPELKELQARFGRNRSQEDIQREIGLLEQRLNRLRLQLLGFKDVPTPNLPPPPVLKRPEPPREPLDFWLEGFGVKAVNS